MLVFQSSACQIRLQNMIIMVHNLGPIVIIHLLHILVRIQTI
jgi:hypothetical protein